MIFTMMCRTRLPPINGARSSRRFIDGLTSWGLRSTYLAVTK